MKYPRTMNLPWSDTQSRDDVFIQDCSCFEGKQVVITEKLDGENTNLYGVSDQYPNGRFHARSQETNHHPSRTWIKQLLAGICFQIPKCDQLCGENLYAHHSIFYTELPSYFFLFNMVRDYVVLSWEEIEYTAESLFLETAPVLYRGLWDEEKVKSIWTGKGNYPTFDGPDGKSVDAEGYVVRLASEFPVTDFHISVAKYVRKNHVQTDEHWMTKEVVPNRLKHVAKCHRK